MQIRIRITSPDDLHILLWSDCHEHSGRLLKASAGSDTKCGIVRNSGEVRLPGTRSDFIFTDVSYYDPEGFWRSAKLLGVQKICRSWG